MASTTIRVDVETHARLLAMSADRGTSLIETVRDATDALRRLRFAEGVAAEIAELRADEQAWADYVGEAEVTAVADGLDR